MNIPLLLAQAAETTAETAAPAVQAPSPIQSLLPLVFIGIIFYFLLIRPQVKRQKEHQKLVDALKVGDAVVMNSGIHGLVTNVKDSTVTVKVADNVKIVFDKAAVARVEKSAS